MPLLADAIALHVGDIPVTKAYLGDTLVWEPPSVGPKVVFSAGGIETTLTSATITIPDGVAESVTLFLMKNQTGGIVSISDPNVQLLVSSSAPNPNRMFVYDCDAADKTFTITWNTNSNATWCVVGMDAPRVGANAFGFASNTTAVIAGPTLETAVQDGDVALGWWSANNTVDAWSTPALDTVLFVQQAAGVRVHGVCGVTPPLAPAGSLILADADRGLEGTVRIEQNAVVLFRKPAATG